MVVFGVCVRLAREGVANERGTNELTMLIPNSLTHHVCTRRETKSETLSTPTADACRAASWWTRRIHPGYYDIEAPALPLCGSGALTRRGAQARARRGRSSRPPDLALGPAGAHQLESNIRELGQSRATTVGRTLLRVQCLDDPCVCESQRVTVQARKKRLDA